MRDREGGKEQRKSNRGIHRIIKPAGQETTRKEMI